ncbi:hypothetical protein [Chitinophaga sp.]|uniref:hypothetical protein n=1 Tax=Chitinophaga sp. TaxID=1869181 RepID=UPI002F95E3F4
MLAITFFDQNPLRLTDEEYNSPETVLKTYFELFGPGETNHLLPAVYTEALTNPGGLCSSAIERMKVLSCFTELYQVVEAAFIISRQK